MLANDLLNRWLFFDEDRNPNNYLVKHDSDGEPFIVVIDYNMADLETTNMKILGLEDKFGWHREGKNRFLTLLKPENFQKFSIDDFHERLTLMGGLDKSFLVDLCLKVFLPDIVDDPAKTADMVANNLVSRISYLDTYFRAWFKESNPEKQKEVDDRYAGLGQSFVDFYKRKT